MRVSHFNAKIIFRGLADMSIDLSDVSMAISPGTKRGFATAIENILRMSADPLPILHDGVARWQNGPQDVTAPVHPQGTAHLE